VLARSPGKDDRRLGRMALQQKSACLGEPQMSGAGLQEYRHLSLRYADFRGSSKRGPRLGCRSAFLSPLRSHA
jgi:hypothetical protein